MFGNTIALAQKSLDCLWKKQEVLSNNLANINTPGYKRQDVSFESQFKRALGNSRYETVDDKVSHLTSTELEARIYTDSANFSYRLDGNNVDIDTETVELASNQIKYNGLVQSMNQEFSNLKLVMK